MINNISIFKFLLLIYGFNNYNTIINIENTIYFKLFLLN